MHVWLDLAPHLARRHQQDIMELQRWPQANHHAHKITGLISTVLSMSAGPTAKDPKFSI